MGIEPTSSPWQGDVLPLNHTCNNKWRSRRDLNSRTRFPRSTPLAGAPLQPLEYYSNWYINNFTLYTLVCQQNRNKKITLVIKYQMVTRMGFEPMNAAVKGQCVKPLHQRAKKNNKWRPK
jgi:hypothetical protein